jgi:hypothetical protein
MGKQAAWLIALLVGSLFAPACDPVGTDTLASVTIDMRCGSTTDCPNGFSCVTDDEHGPPTTMCESTDPAATCPSGYDIKVGHAQTFCMPRAAAGVHNRRGSQASNERNSRAGRVSDGSRDRGF